MRARQAAPSGPAPAAGFPVRRVVTGHDAAGQAVIVSDGVPPRTVTSAAGHGLSELLWFEAPPDGPDAGGEPPAGTHVGFPVDGALACRLLRFPGFAPGTPVEETWLRLPGDDPARPGLHRSETLDLMVVLDGHITLGLDEGEYALGPGDAVIQRGTSHRWRVVGERACTFLSVLMSPDPKAAQPDDPLVLPPSGRDGSGEPRRLVTGTLPDGRSAVMAFGRPSSLVEPVGRAGVGLYDLWQTGGPLSHVTQGGDAAGPWSLEPAGTGVAFRRVEFAAGHDPGDAGFHATRTIDVTIVVSGALRMALPGAGCAKAASTVLNASDIVIQRGTRHRWVPVGPEPAVLVSVMIGLPTHQ